MPPAVRRNVERVFRFLRKMIVARDWCKKAATRANEALEEARRAAGDAVPESQLKIARLEAQVIDLTDDITEKDIRIAELEDELMRLQEKHDRMEDRYLTLKGHMADEERNQKMGFEY